MKIMALSRFYILWISLLCCLGWSASTHAQDYKIYDSLPQLEARIRQAGDTTLIINFWATWCKPCVEELPSFEEMRKRYSDQKVKIILVSLDFKSQMEKKFLPFLRNQKLACEVVLFADQDMNNWIPALEEDWDGAIPATLVFSGEKRGFNLGKFEDYGELETFVRPYLGEVRAPHAIGCGNGK
jgi:thiol-disulfide isomerase/thioredoxin